MEADELPPPEYSVVRSESRVVRQYSSSPNQDKKKVDTSVSRVEHFEPQIVISSSSSDPQNPTGAEQTFFPSFLANIPSIRPFQVPSSLAASIANRYNPHRGGSTFDQSILGSGDFAVMRGGTFYPEEEADDKRYHAKSDKFETFYGDRPVAEALTGKKELYYPEDPFENFKDFADMTAGSDPAFSHFVVIYANKNSTKPHPSHPSPKNIFEQLQMIDQEKLKEKEESDEKVSDEKISEKKLMKLSKYKTKLSKTKIIKKYKKKLGPKENQKSSPDYTDPLLATS